MPSAGSARAALRSRAHRRRAHRTGRRARRPPTALSSAFGRSCPQDVLRARASVKRVGDFLRRKKKKKKKKIRVDERTNR
eukprot:4489583-Prymnesium_polylepis.1